MKRYALRSIAFAMLLAGAMQVRAQRHTRYVDSMQRALQSAKDDTVKANILCGLATFYFNNNTEQGISYGQQGVELARKLGWKQGSVKLYNVLGNCCSYRKDYDKALDYYQKGLKTAEELGDKKGQSIILRNIGNIYSYKLKDYQKASDYYARCLKLEEEVGAPSESADVLSEIGTVYYLRRDYPKAIEYYQQAMKKGESARDKKIVADNLCNISSVCNSQANYPKALEYAQLAQKFMEGNGDKAGLAGILLKMGCIYNNQRDYQRALDHFQRSLKLSEETGRTALIAENLQNIGDVYMSLGDHPRALQNFLRARQLTESQGNKAATGVNLAYIGKSYQAIAENKARVRLPDSLAALTNAEKWSRANYYLARGIDVLKEVGDFNELQDAYEHLSQVQYAMGDNAGAKESFKQHNAYVEGMYNEDKSKEVARKDMQYVFNKKQEVMKEESEQKEMALQREMQLNNLRYEYEKKQAAARSEQEREQLKYEEDLKQRQILYEYERKRAELEARTALANAEAAKKTEIAALRLREARRERVYYWGGLAMLALVTAGLYNRFTILKKNKLVLEEKNRQIAAEKEKADRERVRAENSEKFRQLFLANMSHEIRTPMNAVSGMTEILLEKGPKPEQLAYLKAISKSSDILLHIINDILDLSKIEAGKMELEAIDLSLKDTVQHVVDTLAHRAEEKGLQLLTDIRSDVTDVVIGDPYRLTQILVNLGGNAIKFTERGSVQIDVELLQDEGDSETVRFSIIDTGIGIPEDKVKTIFGNFSQVNASDTRKYGGTGLGLSISRQLVELHKGTISVESVVGSGTTFSFVITYPKGSPQRLQERMRQETKVDGRVLDGLRVLVADDNEYNRIVVNETLMLRSKVEMDMVVNGEEAVQAVKDKDYDVVLMDVQMPVMSGTEATIAIRSTLPAPRKDVPIIALTASTLRADIDRFLQSGMNSYVPKPFKAWQLIKTIADVTGRKMAAVPDEPVIHDAGAPVKEDGMVTDPAYLHRFCEGDEARIKKYINMYLKSVPGFVEKLKEALETKDMKAMASKIHAFKPNWLIMGMKGTSELGSRVERQCTAEPDAAMQGAAELLAQTEQSVRELEPRR